MEYSLPCDPRVLLLHDSETCLDLCDYKLLIINVLVAAKMLVAFNWKLQYFPSREEWIQKFRFILLINLSARVNYYQGHESALAKFKNVGSIFCSTGSL